MRARRLLPSHHEFPGSDALLLDDIELFRSGSGKVLLRPDTIRIGAIFMSKGRIPIG